MFLKFSQYLDPNQPKSKEVVVKTNLRSIVKTANGLITMCRSPHPNYLSWRIMFERCIENAKPREMDTAFKTFEDILGADFFDVGKDKCFAVQVEEPSSELVTHRILFQRGEEVFVISMGVDKCISQ